MSDIDAIDSLIETALADGHTPIKLEMKETTWISLQMAAHRGGVDSGRVQAEPRNYRGVPVEFRDFSDLTIGVITYGGGQQSKA